MARCNRDKMISICIRAQQFIWAIYHMEVSKKEKRFPSLPSYVATGLSQSLYNPKTLPSLPFPSTNQEAKPVFRADSIPIVSISSVSYINMKSELLMLLVVEKNCKQKRRVKV